jgi:hypothetical protein
MAKRGKSRDNLLGLAPNDDVACPHFDGTIACACRGLGGGIGTFVNLARAADPQDPTIARFLPAWDGLDAPAQQDPTAADELCKAIGASPIRRR